MTPERWSQIEDLFHRVAECAPGNRAALLDKECGGDPDLRSEVESLLANEKSASDQMQTVVRGAFSDAGFPLVGQTVSHYRVLEGLGGGGMGLVYRAEDLKLGRQVALKFLPEESTKDSSALGRFEREARSASALEHLNICPIYEFGEHDGQPFLVMQLLEGQTLRELISSATPAKPPLPLEKLLDLAIQIADGLAAAHEKGIIHRDIKPANIFITKQGQAKILDFGLAKIAPVVSVVGDMVEPDFPGEAEPQESLPPEASGRTPDPFLSRTGVAMGTAGYMSPEQARGEKLDARTDLFSFGLVLYEMATGQRAFQGETGPALREAILQQTPVALRQVDARFPVRLQAILEKALEKDRATRYQSAVELCADLRRLKAASERRPRSRQWAIGGVAALLMLSTFWLIARRWISSPPRPEAKFTQLTVNSFENRVTDGAISPDGKYLAYADLNGLYLKRTETGETRPVPQPGEFGGRNVSWEVVPKGWFPDNDRFIINSHPAGEEEADWSSQTSTIWTVSIAGGPPAKLREHAEAYSLSPDGSQISFGSNKGKAGDREIWLMDVNGANAHKLFETAESASIVGLMWLPGGQRVSYLFINNSEGSLVSRDIHGGDFKTLLSEKQDGNINDLLWLPDGRLLYSVNKSGALFDWNYWTLQFDPLTGKRIGKPVQLTNFKDIWVDHASVTSDGKKLAFTKWTPRVTSYLGDLAEGGRRVLSLRHFPQSESSDGLGRWTSDNKALFLISNRTGTYAIYKQLLNSDVPVGPLVMPPDGSRCANWSPNGKWIMYLGNGANSDLGFHQPVPVMRAPQNGGASQQLFTAAGWSVLSCSLSPSTGCAIAEPSEDRKELKVSTLDPLKGRGPELARVALDPNDDNWYFDLSADGSRIAITRTPADPIQILSLQGKPIKEIKVKGWNKIVNFTWASDGKGLYVVAVAHLDQVVLYVDLQGNAYPLWENKGASGETLAYPSPDGKKLVLQGWSSSSNLWQMENF